MTRHWSQDPYWTDALEKFVAMREKGATKLTIDLNAFEETLHNGDGPAYRALEAMVSVHEHEGYEGFRGAPRIVAALLVILSESTT
ncbi:hypothetical protein [Burkholderia sp. 22313]|uniref:hypothetical protein n=1 Tax=Burkholderia sp. 22313 TaxID=3453908 RepID=UPI003F876B93